MSDVKQYLTFGLDQEVFAIQINKVREVVELSRITKVPQAEDYMVGIFNLRGNVVPVIDLRIKFGLTRKDYSQDTSIIIVEALQKENSIVVGALVDAVREVVDIDNQHLEEPPSIGMKLERRFITAIGKRENQFVIVLDMDKVFTESELESANAVASQMAGSPLP
jgi:purine-binding chemotaxis protein CheW